MRAPGRQRTLAAGAAVLVAALIGVGLAQAPREPAAPAPPTPAQARAALAGSPAPLAALHAQANDLLPGGTAAVQRRLASLRRYPVVVNGWSSTCGPCRAEAPVFARAAVEYGRRVAFLGIDNDASTAAGRAFLRTDPVSYPSYFDPGDVVGQAILGSAVHPTTLFLRPDGGGFYTQQGEYTLAELQRDIERYAIR